MLVKANFILKTNWLIYFGTHGTLKSNFSFNEFIYIMNVFNKEWTMWICL